MNYASYFGGNGHDCATSVAVTSRGDAYFAGYTYANPTVYPDEFQASYSAGQGRLYR